MGEAAAGMARPDAARVIVDKVLSSHGEISVAVMLGRTRRIHFVGIGGIGMSGIAGVAGEPGLRGQRIGRAAFRCHDAIGAVIRVMVFEGHKAGQIGDADVVVYSSAVRASNPRSSRLASAEPGDPAPRCWPS